MTAAAKVYRLRRHCFCCDEEHDQPSTVECTAHGPMEMDGPADGFRCAAGACESFLSLDAWQARLATGAGNGLPGPVRLMVTPRPAQAGGVP